MQSKRYDGSGLRTTLAGMIMDRSVCARVASQWSNEGLFDTGWANLVGKLAVDHFRKFNKNPNGQFTGIFENWANSTTADEKTVESVEKFLQSLSDSYNEEPSDYVLDVAGRYFNKVKIQREIEAAQFELAQDDVEEAAERLARLRRVNLGEGSYIQPSDDPTVWEDAFNQSKSRPLFTYRGALGQFIGDSFSRYTLHAFMAPEKVGKTTWLVDATYRALRARNRVAYFDMGDMSQAALIKKLACRVTGKPEYEQQLPLPTKWDDEGKPVSTGVDYKAVDPLDSYRQLHKICKSDDALRMAFYANSSATVSDIDAKLEEWERDGWRADVVVIDYADIILAKGDPNDKIDDLWKALARMRNDRHCCVLTATQCSAEAYNLGGGLLKKKHFQGRRTKFAHVDGMVGINVTPEEKDQECGRINWIVRRKGKFNENAFVRVAGCIGIGNPAIISTR